MFFPNTVNSIMVINHKANLILASWKDG